MKKLSIVAFCFISLALAVDSQSWEEYFSGLPEIGITKTNPNVDEGNSDNSSDSQCWNLDSKKSTLWRIQDKFRLQKIEMNSLKEVKFQTVELPTKNRDLSDQCKFIGATNDPDIVFIIKTSEIENQFYDGMLFDFSSGSILADKIKINPKDPYNDTVYAANDPIKSEIIEVKDIQYPNAPRLVRTSLISGKELSSIKLGVELKFVDKIAVSSDGTAVFIWGGINSLSERGDMYEPVIIKVSDKNSRILYKGTAISRKLEGYNLALYDYNIASNLFAIIEDKRLIIYQGLKRSVTKILIDTNEEYQITFNNSGSILNIFLKDTSLSINPLTGNVLGYWKNPDFVVNLESRILFSADDERFISAGRIFESRSPDLGFTSFSLRFKPSEMTITKSAIERKLESICSSGILTLRECAEIRTIIDKNTFNQIPLLTLWVNGSITDSEFVSRWRKPERK